MSLTEVNWTGLPVPSDDGATDHLQGTDVKPIELTATAGDPVSLAGLAGRTVVYIYPMTGRPDRDLPEGWDSIPGARGCTPQSCAFRDHHAELKARGVDHLFGMSTQTSAYQREAAERLHLPFPLLSDAQLEFTHAHQLPTFEADGQTLIKRLTLIIDDGAVSKVFYPVFPPDANAQAVIDWLEG